MSRLEIQNGLGLKQRGREVQRSCCKTPHCAPNTHPIQYLSSLGSDQNVAFRRGGIQIEITKTPGRMFTEPRMPAQVRVDISDIASPTSKESYIVQEIGLTGIRVDPNIKPHVSPYLSKDPENFRDVALSRFRHAGRIARFVHNQLRANSPHTAHQTT